MEITKEHTRALDRAKIGLMRTKNSTFIATVLFSLKFSWDDSIPTACTNGLNLQINPTFFLDLSEDHRVFVLAHEAWHVAFQHMTRYGTRTFKIWNMATDYVINNLLFNQGYGMPDWVLRDHQYDGLTAEQVYKILEQDPSSQPSNFQMDMQAPGDGQSTPGDQQAIDDQITRVLIKATTRAKMSNQEAGSIPGDILAGLQKLLNPKLPWHIILARYLSDMAPEDYSMRKFNKRFLPDFYLPTLHSEALGEIVCAVDTSGSVTDEQFTQFISEIQGIKSQLNPKKLTVLDFDTCIRAIHTLDETQDVSSISFTGRGGTRVEEVLEYMNTHRPQAMLIFTDGYFTYPDIAPEVPLIWIIHSNGYQDFKFPHGKIIEYQDS